MIYSFFNRKGSLKYSKVTKILSSSRVSLRSFQDNP